MSRQHMERNRLKLQLENTIRELNHEIINPEIPELKLADLEPILKLVARSRGAYLKELFKVTEAAEGGMPSAEQVQQLSKCRVIFEELRSASKALETAIGRGYLDVLSD